jgi:hypothetical protein
LDGGILRGPRGAAALLTARKPAVLAALDRVAGHADRHSSFVRDLRHRAPTSVIRSRKAPASTRARLASEKFTYNRSPSTQKMASCR